MKRAEWPGSQDPAGMLYALRGARKSGRKLRLFACACCRGVWHLLPDGRSRRGVEAAEAFADGLLTATQASEASEAAHAVVLEMGVPDSRFLGDAVRMSDANREAAQAVPAALSRYETPQDSHWHASITSYQAINAASLGEAATHPPGLIAEYARAATEARERAVQADRLRCIFGNPFRRAALSPDCRIPTVVALARAADEERSLPSGSLVNARLAVLSDALEEAGCMDESLLSHLRSPGPHVRGCWPLDLILAKDR